MIVLALDSALDACSAAVWEDGRTLARAVAPGARDQAERLVPIVEETRRAAGLAWVAVDRIAVTVGPGSFTGLRIGLAAARGFALAIERPAVGVGTLEALAASAPDGVPVAAAIDAGRGDVFFQAFDAARIPLGPPESLSLEEATKRLPLGAHVVGGAAAALLARAPGRADLVLPPLPPYPDPVAVAVLGAAKELPADGRPPAPLYIHPPRIKLPGTA